ncbi:MAG: AI-2E family transporter, partial [Ilumatobacter sp.]
MDRGRPGNQSLLPSLFDRTDDRTDAIDQTDPPDQLRVRVFVLVGLVATGVAAVAVARGVDRLGDVLGLILAAAVLAVITLPLTRWLTRIGGGPAVALTAAISLVVSLTVGYLVLRDLGTQAESVAALITERLDGIDPATTFGRVVDSLSIDSAIEVWLGQVPELVVVGEETGTGIGRQLVALVTVVILAAFLQSSGEQVANWFVSLWPRVSEQRARRSAEEDEDDDDEGDDGADDLEPVVSPRKVVREILRDVERRGIAMVRRTIILASAVTVLVTAVCSLLGTPGAIVLGLWAGAWFVVPTIGWAVGLAPLALVAWVEGTTSVAAALAATIVIAVATTLTRRRLVDGATLRLGVGPYVLGLVIGVAMGGVAGSVIGLTAVAVVAAVATADQTLPRPSPWMVDAEATRLVGGVRIPTGWRGAALVVAAAALGVVMWVGLVRVAPAIVWLL